jgi:hypothetical protein
MPRIRLFQVLSDPDPDVGDLRERVSGDLLASVELGETDAEAEIVDILIGNDVVDSGRDWRLGEQFQQFVTGKAPPFGISKGRLVLKR